MLAVIEGEVEKGGRRTRSTEWIYNMHQRVPFFHDTTQLSGVVQNLAY